MEAAFWISVAAVAYTYLVYPFIIIFWGTFFPRRIAKRYQENLTVSVVVAAKNEEINIKARVDNLLEQDYPAELVEIIVVSDGSTDRTVDVVREHGGERVKVIVCEEPVGKAGALNKGIAAASNEIVVFADARQRFSPNALAELTAIFFDSRVGAVSGELIIEPGIYSEVHEGVGLYWNYEKLIRRKESAVDSVVGATGSIYAIRRHLYQPLEPHTLLDDFLIPMRIVLRGYRVIFVRSARAFDISSRTSSQEFRRKVRTLAGNFQALAMEKQLLNPFRNRLFFQFVSHKLARLVVPYFCVIAFASNATLDGAFYRVVFLLQVLFYGAAVLHRTPLARAGLGRLIRVPWTFVVLNAAAVVGFWVFATGRDRAAWK